MITRLFIRILTFRGQVIKFADRATYQGIVKKLSTREFVEDVGIVKDCLTQLSLLSESLQRQQTSLIEANRHLQWTLNALFRINSGRNVHVPMDNWK
jgi:hypothetical protein